MKRITRNIELVEAWDLLERAEPRACLAFADDQGPQVEPVNVVVDDGRYMVGVPASAAHAIALGDEAVLLVDQGFQFFDLRAIYVRGHIQPPPEDTAGLAGGLVWFAVQPTRAVAWDYGRLRQADDPS